MKKILLFTIITALFFAGCDSWLERQPDDPLTYENLFLKEATTRQYLIGLYAYQINETYFGGQSTPWWGSSDEGACSYKSRTHSTYNLGAFTANSNFTSGNTYTNYWRGIRETSYFMQNVYSCPEITDQIKLEWYSEAKFLRAYYYSLLMKVYGPVFLLGEEPVDMNDEQLRYTDRSTWDECIEFVEKELWDAAQNLPEVYLDKTWYGRATKGAALAARARILLYSARPLFNGEGNNTTVVRRLDGEHLFPTSPDPDKWVLAAQAAKDVMDLGLYELVGADGSDPLGSLKSVAIDRLHNEHIWTMELSGNQLRMVITPSFLTGNHYGGVGPTQKMVDSFAMSNGRYPITGYNSDGSPIIDPASGYTEGYSASSFTTFYHPLNEENLANTWEIFQDREPRFYVNVFWSGMIWHYNTTQSGTAEFFAGGNSGYTTANQNYSPTGYLFYKFADPSLNTSSGSWGQLSWPLFRYAETLLNRAEALNEIDPSDPEILTLLNQVRKRAGVPDIQDVYPEAEGDKLAMRELILRERMLELHGEHHRFFDTRTWLIAEKEDAGPMYGLNILATDHAPGGEFWKRVIIQDDGTGAPSDRNFSPRMYLFPIPQAELDRTEVTQNWGW